MGAALGHLEKTSRWDSDLQEYMFRRVRREARSGARVLKESGPLAVTRATVEGFDAAAYYNTLLDAFPFLTTTLTAAASRPGRGKTYMDTLQVSLVFSSSSRFLKH